MNTGGGTSTVDLTDGTITITRKRFGMFLHFYSLKPFSIDIPDMEISLNSIFNSGIRQYYLDITDEIAERDYMLATLKVDAKTYKFYIVARNGKLEILNTDTMKVVITGPIGTTNYPVAVDSLINYV